MTSTFIAQAHITISAPIATVWDALVNPEMIKQYMFGTNAVSDWKEGSPIVWKGEWEGKPSFGSSRRASTLSYRHARVVHRGERHDSPVISR